VTALSTWAQVLDALEASADAVEAVVADPDRGASSAVPFSPAPELGPLPGALRGRAEAVLDRLRAAEEALRSRCELVNQELALVAGSRAPSGARYVDTHA
jgi:hypothetical protein